MVPVRMLAALSILPRSQRMTQCRGARLAYAIGGSGGIGGDELADWAGGGRLTSLRIHCETKVGTCNAIAAHAIAADGGLSHYVRPLRELLTGRHGCVLKLSLKFCP